MTENVALTESIMSIVDDIDEKAITLPEFQRDFRWDVEKTYDLFDSLARDIFIGTIIYGKPSFPISCREIDKRPRKGEGSRTKLSVESFTIEDIKRKVQVDNFRLVLDGQQRLTSMYRAVCGIDPIYLILKEGPTGSNLEDLMDQLDSFGGEENNHRISVSVHDAYRVDREGWRESKILSRFKETKYVAEHLVTWDSATLDANFEIYLKALRLLQDLLKRDKLVAYYLLDMSLSKFCTFFERSNSLGIQLNFTDILAAKLYNGFNLRDAIDQFEASYPQIVFNRELIIRAISYVTSNGTSVDKDYILRMLQPEDFSKYWDEVCELYVQALNFLYDNYFILSQEWMASENMLLPLMIFLREVRGIHRMNREQFRFIEFWFWSSTFAAARYAGGASNEVIIEDAKILTKIAKGEQHFDSTYLRRLRSRITDPDDILSFRKKSNSVYKGLLSMINYGSRGLLDWSNASKLTFNQALDDHHIFPKGFVSKANQYRDNFQAQELVDCVANRTLIPKNTNLQIGSKSPSKYLATIQSHNDQLAEVLQTHLINPVILDPDSDELFEAILQDRSVAMFELVDRYTRQAAQTFSNYFPNTSPQKSTDKIPVFCEYKGERFEAFFLPSEQLVEFRGQVMAATSAVREAIKEAGGVGRSRSGWSLWKYVDKSGQEQPIDTLRQQ